MANKFTFGGASSNPETVNKLRESSWLSRYPHAVLIDLDKAAGLYETSQGSEAERIDTAFLMSRVNYMGTDGVRGKVVTKTEKNFIEDLQNNNAFTPDLVEITSYSFAKLLIAQNIHRLGDAVVIGNDGRDLAYDWLLNNGVRAGFQKAGLNVLDLGIVPTGVIPKKCLELGHAAGACLTASHNPSNQNGIKFFIGGKKLVPEGPLGDFALSAYMYNYCYNEKLPAELSGEVTEQNAEDESVDWLTEVLGGEMPKALSGVKLIFDSANGAFDSTGRKVLARLGADYISVNEKCTGDNINRNVGVAEIEGVEIFAGSDYEKHIRTIKEIFDTGRKSPEGSAYGIALDGDGDRGFLLYYSKKSDNVYVLDGDKCGYILAKYLIKSQNLNPAEHYFLSTIESDLMTSAAAEKDLGLRTKIVSVGDKWIGNFAEGNVLVGLEISGHLIYPIAIKAPNGEEKTLLTGIGLLTALSSLCAIKGLGLNEEEIIEPYKPGFSKTYYVFFVDKSLHYRGSAIWNKDKEIIEAEIKTLKNSGNLPKDTSIDYEDKEDLNVLYANIRAGNSLIGVFFMRNSGTEDKNAVYVKGVSEYSGVLCTVGQKIQKMHTAEMKNKNRAEYIYEQAVMKSLEKNGGKTTIDKILATLENVSESDLFAVVYGLRKEERVSLDERKIIAL